LHHVNITAPKSCDIYNARGVVIVDSQFISASNTTFRFYNAQVAISNSLPGAAPVTLDGLTTNSLHNELSFFNAQASLNNTNLLGASPLLTLGNGGLVVISNKLRFSTNAVFNFTLGTNSGRVVATGIFDTPSGRLNITGGPGFRAGTYDLFTFNTRLNNTLPTIGTSPAGYAYSVDINSSRLALIVSNAAAPSSPVFGGMSSSDGSLFFSGTGGGANGTYYVLTTSNVALPLSNWSRLATNQFNGSGGFDFSFAIGANQAGQFFRLHAP
jgi:hypothetical protein